MNTWGPLGVVATLVLGVCGAGSVLCLVGTLWQIGIVLGALGWPLILIVVALAVVVAWWYRLAHLQPALPAPALPKLERFCGQCGSQLVAGCCCDGM